MLHTHEGSELEKDKQGRALIVKKQDLLESKLYSKPFDFYGQEIRLLTVPERENVIEEVVVREKNAQIAKLLDENYLLNSQVTALKDFWRKSQEECSSLKHEIARLGEVAKLVKRDHDLEKIKQAARFQDKIDKLKDEIADIKHHHKCYRNMVEAEYGLKEVIQDMLESQLNIFKENARKMRAVLRVPRLCKMFHDTVSGPASRRDFQILDQLYEKHFLKVAE